MDPRGKDWETQKAEAGARVHCQLCRQRGPFGPSSRCKVLKSELQSCLIDWRDSSSFWKKGIWPLSHFPRKEKAKVERGPEIPRTPLEPKVKKAQIGAGFAWRTEAVSVTINVNSIRCDPWLQQIWQHELPSIMVNNIHCHILRHTPQWNRFFWSPWQCEKMVAGKK